MAGIVLDVGDSKQVDSIFGVDWVFPEICIAKRYFQTPCPACGLTRSFISILHGRWSDAFGFHSVGPLVFVAIVLQIPYGLQLRFAKNPWLPDRNFVRFLWGALLAILLLRWAL